MKKNDKHFIDVSAANFKMSSVYYIYIFFLNIFFFDEVIFFLHARTFSPFSPETLCFFLAH